MASSKENNLKNSVYRDAFLDISSKSRKTAEKPSSKKMEKDTEELELENAVFGNINNFSSFLDKENETFDVMMNEAPELSEDNDAQEDELEKLEDAELFMFDTGSADGAKDSVPLDIIAGDNTVKEDEEASNEIPSIWEDSDDERLMISLQDHSRLRKLRQYEDEDMVNGLQYARRLRTQFERVYPVPEWAKKQDVTEEEDEFNALSEKSVIPKSLKSLFKSSVSYINQSSKLLAPGTINIKRLKDANFQAPSHSGIRCMSIHPYFPLLLTCGFDRTLRIYQLDGKVNPLVTSLHLRSSALQTALFHPDGKRVIAAGRRKYMYIWDLESAQVQKVSRMYGQENFQPSMERFHVDPTGKYIALEGRSGHINLLHALTGQFATSFKIEGVLSDVLFTSDGSEMLVLSYGAEVWHFNVEQRSVVRRWQVQDGVSTTHFCLDPSNKYLAIGSKSGIVNIYDLQTSNADAAPKPVTTLDNITFSINSMSFSQDSQVLAIASRGKKDTLRLVHVPSFSVFRNWPTSATPLGRVTCLAFGKGGELCVGNEAGRVGLWKLAHYD
ncbi:small subunit processome, CGI-48 family Utp18 [Schizosaccharomyces pombe]